MTPGNRGQWYLGMTTPKRLPPISTLVPNHRRGRVRRSIWLLRLAQPSEGMDQAEECDFCVFSFPWTEHSNCVPPFKSISLSVLAVKCLLAAKYFQFYSLVQQHISVSFSNCKYYDKLSERLCTQARGFINMSSFIHSSDVILRVMRSLFSCH